MPDEGSVVLPEHHETRRPNVIWFLGDQHRAQATGANDPNLSTPNLDRLEERGMKFVEAVSGYPLCCPYRGALVTSVYPHKGVNGHEVPLPPGMPTLAEPFNREGYATAYFGKWHLAGFKEKNGHPVLQKVPRKQRGGFGTWLGYENNNDPLNCVLHGHEEDEERDFRRYPGYETDVLTNELVDFVHKRKRDKRPFFAVMSAQPPHDPYDALPPGGPHDLWERAERIQLRPNVPLDRLDVRERMQLRLDLAGYYEAIERLDHNLGHLVAELDALDLLCSTHIIFLSDHGDMHGSHGERLKTHPYEESIRIPFVIGGGYGYPHLVGSASAVINHVDVAPTTLKLCDIDVPPGMQGFDYSHNRRPPMLSPLAVDHVQLSQRIAAEPEAALLQLVYPTAPSRHSVRFTWRGIVTRDRWKYITRDGGRPHLLFDLNSDPFEEEDLKGRPQFAAKQRQLHEMLEQLLLSNDDTDDYHLRRAQRRPAHGKAPKAKPAQAPAAGGGGAARAAAVEAEGSPTKKCAGEGTAALPYLWPGISPESKSRVHQATVRMCSECFECKPTTRGQLGDGYIWYCYKCWISWHEQDNNTWAADAFKSLDAQFA